MRLIKNLNGTGTLLAFGLVSSAKAQTHTVIGPVPFDEERPDPTSKGKYYPPGSPECSMGGTATVGGCTVYKDHQLEGVPLALALVGVLVFAVSVVAIIIWSNKKNKRQKSLE